MQPLVTKGVSRMDLVPGRTTSGVLRAGLNQVVIGARTATRYTLRELKRIQARDEYSAVF
jgi:hypothetical protein